MAKKNPFQRWLRCAPMRWLFPDLDLIIGVSEGVVEDTILITGLPREKLIALPNPVITPKVYQKAAEPINHPWFINPTLPVILGAGRLTQEKDFATLIRAFQLVRKQKECRLVIIGEGPMRSELEQLIAELNLAEAVAMPGFTDNPFAYMKKSSLFVLSSAWEGSGNVLIEAMALGIPVVSTDCPYGPSETLSRGKFGQLVQVGNPALMAEAILNTLRNPLPSITLQNAVADFGVERSTSRYLTALNL
jgi:glycosyltransferase involved in cell wall biosynthesis